MRIARHFPAPVAVVASIACIQVSTGLSGRLLLTTGVPALVICRMTIGGLLVVGCTVGRSTARYTAADHRRIGVLGVTMAGSSLFLFEAILRIPLGIAVTIEFLGPLCVSLRGVRQRSDVLWPLLAFAGVMLLAGDIVGGTSLIGFLYAGLAGLSWAAYIGVMSTLRTAGIRQLGLAMLVAAVLVAPFGIAPLTRVNIGMNQVALVLFVAAVGTALPLILEAACLRTMRAASFAVLMSVEPAAAALFGLVVLHQPLTGPQILAIALVIAACVGVNTVMSLHRPATVRAAQARGDLGLLPTSMIGKAVDVRE